MANGIQIGGSGLQFTSGSTLVQVTESIFIGGPSGSFINVIDETNVKTIGVWEIESDTDKSIQFRIPSESFGGSSDRISYYVSSSGKIGIGTSNPKNDFDIKANTFKIRSDDGTKELEFTAEGKLITKEYGTNASGSELLLSFDRGTFGSETGVVDGDVLGKIRYGSISGSNIEVATAAIIETIAINTGGQGLPGGNLIFKTARDGNTSVTEIMKLGYAAIPEINNQDGVLISSYLNVKNNAYFTGSIHCYSTISGSSLGNTPINGGTF